MIVSRKPAANEMDLLSKYYTAQESDFTKNKEAAQKFILAGEFTMDKTADPVKLAALMQVIHTIFNLDESETKS